MLGHWRFDEGQGNETYDSTGISPTGSLFSGVTWSQGKSSSYKQAVRFDGSDFPYLDLGDFRIDDEISVSVWTYKENLASFQRIFDFSRDSGVDNLFLSNRWSTNQAEWTIFRNRTQRSLTVQDFWELDKWQHVVATIDQNGVMKLFSDGQLRGSILGHLPRSTVRTSQLLGKSNDGDHAYFKGMMDDLRLYGRALPREEVELIYNGDLEEEIILGGEDPQISIFWGDEDAGDSQEINASSSTAWDQKIDLGTLGIGLFTHDLFGLPSNQVFYYRIAAENSAGIKWADESQSFTTGDFRSDRIHL